MRQKGFKEIIILAGILITVISLYFVFKPKELVKPQLSNNNPTKNKTNTVTQDNNWITYKNISLALTIKYPSDFLISENNNVVKIYSKIYPCETENTPPYLERVKMEASEVSIEIKELNGINYNEIWKKEYGFDLIGNINGKLQNNYDGIEYCGGKKAYYFHQGAEMTFGRKAILIEKTPTSAIQINSWTPILVYGCDNELNKYQGVADKIISSIKFAD